MASSDDEEDTVPQTVTNYYFVDDEETPISFSVLPIQFKESEKPDASEKQVFLHGTADGGLQKVYKQVTAWKLGLEDDQPEVSVLSKDNKWIRLLKPRKSFEDIIRTIMITVEWLHFLKKKPESSEKSVLEHLRKVFSSFEVRPSVDDLLDHLLLISIFSEKDETLATCQLLLMFLKEKPRERATYDGDVQIDPDANKPFIDDRDQVDEGTRDTDGDESEEESDLFDSVCSLCDNGGELLCCEGKCMRSFHPTKADGVESECKSLGYSRAQVEAIQNFLCLNCQYKQHQCFACGKLGSSDKSSGAEVFPCISATCGRFYHPKCVAELVYKENEAEATELQKKIVSGESFTCPIHKCLVCKQGENKEDEELQFAICRRCPRSYHRKCLPRKIAFDDIEEEDIVQRAWDDLLPNRILIYCLKHKIDEDLGTPKRNHIIFPEIPDKKKATDVQKNKVKVLAKKKRQDSDDLPRERTSSKLKFAEKLSRLEERPSMSKGIRTTEQVLDTQKKVKLLKASPQPDSRKADGHSIPEDHKISLKLKAPASAPIVSPTFAGKTLGSSFPVVDAETEKKMIALMEKVSSSITLEDITRKRTMPSTHAHSSRHIDKSITHGKVEGSVEAIRTALQKLEDGSSVEDAKAVCEPEILNQILKWRSKLKVYLAPFIHGMRYTSFGRHFTKVDKLKEIVDKLHWYIQNGDTIVDFCCGSNDFSVLMKEKLDAMGKKCLFKNYDVIQPKNDFSFEKRDWMRVRPKELPTGSQLIMGLNPPFGVKASLANKFIDKALEFKPKLIILIVPKETERLDEKQAAYDLIWEDNEQLSGKSFYLPGSVDVNDKQMEQWNVKPPPLYLWSRPDWTAKHKTIAKKYGHTSSDNKSPVAEIHKERLVSDRQKEDSKRPDDQPEQRDTEGNEKRDVAPKENSRRGEEARREDTKNEVHSIKRRSPENHKDRPRKRGKPRSNSEAFEFKRNVEASEGRKAGDELSDMSISPPKTDPRNMFEGRLPPETFETPSERETSRSGFPEPEIYAGPRSSTVLNDDIDEIAKRYTTSNREGLFNSNSRNWASGGMASLDYGIRSTEERYPGYARDSSVEGFGRSPYTNDLDVFGRSSEADLRLQTRLYGLQGQDDLSQRNRYALGGSDPGLGQTSLFSSSAYGGLSTPIPGSSAMQRYAPRLDETNYTRPGNFTPSVPLPGRGSFFDVPGTRGSDSMGFAPGPQNPFPHQGSSGWLNE